MGFSRNSVKETWIHQTTMLKATACMISLLCCDLSAAEEQWAVTLHRRDVAIRMWQADDARAKAGVLVLVPGY